MADRHRDHPAHRGGPGMKRAATAALMTLCSLGPAHAASFGDHVDIQCRVGLIGPRNQVITANADVTVGRNASPGVPGIFPYWVCNEDIPYIPQDRWLCVTDVHTHAYGKNGNDMGGMVFVTWLHRRAGHDYHGFTTPPSVSRTVPMAFPPGDEIVLTVKNSRSEVRWVRAQLAGYLGQLGDVPRKEACK